MKLILSVEEMRTAVREFYPPPAGYEIGDVSIQPYSNDFARIEFVRVELVNVADDAKVVPLNSELPLSSPEAA